MTIRFIWTQWRRSAQPDSCDERRGNEQCYVSASLEQITIHPMPKSVRNAWYTSLLACPDCRSEVSIGARDVSCTRCELRREFGSTLDLRPDKPVSRAISTLAQTPDCDAVLASLNTTTPPETYVGPAAQRLSTGFMSEIERRLARGDRVLDLGCGPRDQSVPIEFLGLEYIGIDVSGDAADLLGDAHAIPFADSTFDCVFSYAVLEHLHSPSLALSEIERVLKPGGILIGSVSQGEPFHDAYFHMTAWGVISLGRAAPTLRLSKLWGAGDALWSLGTMGRYPKLVKMLIRAVHWGHQSFPFLAPRRLRWTQTNRRHASCGQRDVPV